MTREEQDAFAARSHNRAHDARESGRLDAEIVAVNVATKAKGKVVVDALPKLGVAKLQGHEPSTQFTLDREGFTPFVTGDVPFTRVDRDEAVRGDSTVETLAKLRPLEKNGTITAGNAPGVNDGAAALVLASSDWATQHGHAALATVLDHATVGWDSPYICMTPAMAAQKLLDKTGIARDQINVWEINEAFAAVAITSSRKLGLAEGVINQNGGAVAMGHPIGASGARIIAAVVNQLRARGGGYGIASICSGGGQGDAVLIKVD